jgi:hypothetical protein
VTDSDLREADTFGSAFTSEPLNTSSRMKNSAINLATRREQKGVTVAECKSHMHFPR